MAILMLRHGPTALNGQVNDSTDRIRGWSDLPLTPKGQLIAVHAAQEHKDYPIKHVFSSNLQRASDTARMLAIATKVPMTVHQELRPWNLGELTGQPTKEVLKTIETLVANPTVKAPGGESFNDFLQRYLPFILPLVHDQNLYGVVSHIRNIKTIEAFLAGHEKGIDSKTWKQEPNIEPGHSVLVTPKGVKKA